MENANIASRICAGALMMQARAPCLSSGLYVPAFPFRSLLSGLSVRPSRICAGALMMQARAPCLPSGL